MHVLFRHRGLSAETFRHFRDRMHWNFHVPKVKKNFFQNSLSKNTVFLFFNIFFKTFFQIKTFSKKGFSNKKVLL